jgi:hypothetical protein
MAKAECGGRVRRLFGRCSVLVRNPFKGDRPAGQEKTAKARLNSAPFSQIRMAFSRWPGAVKAQNCEADA